MNRPPKGHNVSNLAAWGWEWDGPSGDRYQLMVLRGASGRTMMSVRPSSGPNTGRWIGPTTCAITWSTDGTWQGFIAMVTRFLTEGNGNG